MIHYKWYDEKARWQINYNNTIFKYLHTQQQKEMFKYPQNKWYFLNYLHIIFYIFIKTIKIEKLLYETCWFHLNTSLKRMISDISNLYFLKNILATFLNFVCFWIFSLFLTNFENLLETKVLQNEPHSFWYDLKNKTP